MDISGSSLNSSDSTAKAESTADTFHLLTVVTIIIVHSLFLEIMIAIRNIQVVIRIT